jgi:hypothetical protein
MRIEYTCMRVESTHMRVESTRITARLQCLTDCLFDKHACDTFFRQPQLCACELGLS